MQLSQKETSLLKELIEQEKLCAERYDKHSQQAHDSQLKQLFSQLADTERQHLDTLNLISSGSSPQVPAQGQQGGQQEMQFSQTYGQDDTPEKRDDCYLCSDLLGAEKFASGLYDTSVFEFRDMNTRQVLNHIQSEEQQHGKKIYDYMAANNMYQVS